MFEAPSLESIMRLSVLRDHDVDDRRVNNCHWNYVGLHLAKTSRPGLHVKMEQLDDVFHNRGAG